MSDTDSAWLDTMVKKLLDTLESQIEQAARAVPAAKSPAARAANARVLLSLERTLERLAKMERDRQELREKKVVERDGGTGSRAALERRLDKLLAAVPESGAARKPGRK